MNGRAAHRRGAEAQEQGLPVRRETNAKSRGCGLEESWILCDHRGARGRRLNWGPHSRRARSCIRAVYRPVSLVGGSGSPMLVSASRGGGPRISLPFMGTDEVCEPSASADRNLTLSPPPGNTGRFCWWVAIPLTSCRLRHFRNHTVHDSDPDEPSHILLDPGACIR